MQFVNQDLARSDIDAIHGLVLLQFGADSCGHCQAAQPAVESALASRDGIHHLKIEDGKGRPLGRSFTVKLWPTLILLKDGREIGRIVRPTTVGEVNGLLDQAR